MFKYSICAVVLIVAIPNTGYSQLPTDTQDLDIYYREFYTQPKVFTIQGSKKWVEFKIIYDTDNKKFKANRSKRYIAVSKDNPCFLEIIVNSDTTQIFFSMAGVVIPDSVGTGMIHDVDKNYKWIDKIRFPIALKSNTDCAVYCKITTVADERKIRTSYDCNAEWGEVQFMHENTLVDNSKFVRRLELANKDSIKTLLNNNFHSPKLSLLNFKWELYKFKDLESLSGLLLDSLDSENKLPKRITANIEKVRTHKFPIKSGYSIWGSSYGIAMLIKANSGDNAFKNFASGFSVSTLFFSPFIIRSFEHGYLAIDKDRSFNQPIINDQWDINFSLFPFIFLLADFIEGDGLNAFGAIKSKIADPPKLPNKPIILPLQLRINL